MKILKPLLWFIFVVLLIAALGYMLRKPIMRALGNHLVLEDSMVKVDAAFVLSGMPLERCQEAARIYRQGHTPLLVVTGENISDHLRALQIRMPDALVMERTLRDLGIDSTGIALLPTGTSTFEESEAILGYAEEKAYKRVMIISSKFHTRRIAGVFKDKFRDAGIEVFVRGADPIDYTIDKWWLSEQGLLFVNNEYMKSIYYWIRYR